MKKIYLSPVVEESELYLSSVLCESGDSLPGDPNDPYSHAPKPRPDKPF